MTKKHFISLADAIRQHNKRLNPGLGFSTLELDTIADWCREQNPAFNRRRWLDYIAGECGPNGGKVSAK